MNYLKSLALLLFSISILTSCSEDEFFQTDVYSMNDTKGNEKNTKSTAADANEDETNESTGSGNISIVVEEPDVVDIDFVVTLP